MPTAELNRFLEQVTAAHPPASPGKREVRILYGAQTGVKPPTFVLFTTSPAVFAPAYEKSFVQKMRDSFGLEGTPVRLLMRSGKKKKT